MEAEWKEEPDLRLIPDKTKGFFLLMICIALAALVYTPSTAKPDSESGSLQGKRWVSYGDSITKRGGWQEPVAARFGLVHVNLSVGSASMAGDQMLDLNSFFHLNRIYRQDPDVVTILAGANDLADPDVTLGTEEEFEKPLADKNVWIFLGAYSRVVESLLAWKPGLRIVILGTTWARKDGFNIRPFSSSLTLGDFSEASRKVAEHYGLPFVDLYAEAGFDAATMGPPPRDKYSADGLHPNAAGAARIAELVARCFEREIRFD